nr:GAF domain-containing protein [Tanacetum cinerariifolium]
DQPNVFFFKIYHDGCFTLKPVRAYVGAQLSHVDVVDIDEFYLHDLNEMVAQLGYGVADLMHYHFLRPRLSLGYGPHPLTGDVDVLELEKYVKDNKIIFVYVEYGSTTIESIFATPKNGVVIEEVDNQLRKAPIVIDGSRDVNKNLIPICSRNLTKEWEEGTSKALTIGDVMKKFRLTAEETNPLDDLDYILCEYANTGRVRTNHVEAPVEDVVDCDRVDETQKVGHLGNYIEVKGDIENGTKEDKYPCFYKCLLHILLKAYGRLEH